MGWSGPGAGVSSTLSREQELDVLKQQAASVEQTLGELKSRLRELGATEPDTGTTTEK
jgi:hypothetical protein